MVTTASASATASPADPAARHPRSPARSSAAAERSKARTSWPALARLAAMPPPILPSPMKPIRILSPLPLRRALVDERAHAFLLVLAAEQAVEQPPLEDDALGKAGLERGVDHLLGRDRRERGHRRNLP